VNPPLLKRLAIRAPLHPIFVHFTIALTVASFLFDGASLILGARGLADAAWWAIAAAAAVTGLTVATGVASRLRLPIEEGNEARSFLRLHMALGPLVLGLIVLTAAWRAVAWEQAAAPSGWYIGWCGLVLLAVAAQGFLGGEMVYRYGMEVKGGYRVLRVPQARPQRIRAPE